MSYFGSPSSHFHWMLDFSLAPLLPLALCLEISIRFPGLQLVQVALLVVQSLHSHLSVGSFVLVACLNSQMGRYLS
jgi:hypothetical protein